MTRLRDITQMIRSKNAGPFTLTFDFMFKTRADYERTRDAGVLNRRLIADLFKIEEEKVRVFHYEPANSIKISLPRYVTSGNLEDSDVFGGQQYGPLVDLEVPDQP